MSRTKKNGEEININISNSPLEAGRDIDIKGKESTVTTTGNIGKDAKVVFGDDASGLETADLISMLADWKSELEAKIEADPDLLAEDKEDLKETVSKIEAEAAKGDQANPGRLERLLNSIAGMGPDIFEVAVTTLANPLSGVGLVLKKVGDKAKLEREEQAS